MRSAALWLVLFAAYAATLGLHAFDDSDYGGDEPHYLLAAESIVDDGDVDVKDEYAARAYDDFYPYDLDVHGDETEGRLHEPHGVGLPAAHRARLRDRRRPGGRAVPGGDRRAGGGAGLPAGAAGGARPVGERRGAGRRAEPAVRGLRHAPSIPS